MRTSSLFVVVAAIWALSLASCAHSPQTGTQIASKTLTPDQASSINVVTPDARETAKSENCIALWKEAVAKHTRRVITEGRRDLAEVKRLVRQATSAEEEKAWQNKQRIYQLAQEAMKQRLNQPPTDPNLAQKFDGEVKKQMMESFRKAFDKGVEDQIEQSYTEVTGEPVPPQPPAPATKL